MPTGTPLYDLRGKRVFVTGHRGMVGSALVRRLQTEPVAEIITRSRTELDLTNQAAVQTFFEAERPDAVIHAAGKVGGILANSDYPADFLYDNLMMAGNVIHAAFAAGTEKLLYLGSSCIYPKHAPQPITEDALLSGPLEPTNEAYAISKIAGLKLCQAYRGQHGADFNSAMPTNLYGPGDNFSLHGSHVIPALMRKAHEAKMAGASDMEIWGTGSPRREFLHVDDCADALVHVLTHASEREPINIGAGEDIPIADLARLIMYVVGFDGALRFDTSKPDGTPRKIMDSAKLRALGWQPKTDLRDGLAATYDWFLAQDGDVRGA